MKVSRKLIRMLSIVALLAVGVAAATSPSVLFSSRVFRAGRAGGHRGQVGLQHKNRRNSPDMTWYALRQARTPEEVDLALAAGAYIDMQDDLERTILYYAVRRSDFELAAHIIARGADVNLIDYQGMTPIFYAVSSTNTGMFSLLLAHNARVDIYDRYGDSLLIYVVRIANVQAVKALIAAGAVVNDSDYSGKTPIHKLAAGYDINSKRALLFQVEETLALLLANGCDINAQDCIGNTALHYAAKYDERETIEFLIAHGADPRIKNDDGLTPAQVAENPELADFVERQVAALVYKEEKCRKKNADERQWQCELMQLEQEMEEHYR